MQPFQQLQPIFSINILFFILLFVFVMHALILSYHWFSFGTSKHTSLVALTTYLLGGSLLFITLASSLFLS